MTHLLTAVFELGMFCWFGSLLTSAVSIIKNLKLCLVDSSRIWSIDNFLSLDNFKRFILSIHGVLPMLRNGVIMSYGAENSSNII
jgi:hypothetical protein